jgi:hypothetical protein
VRDDDLKGIGPWDFQELGHEDLRELRGAGLLAAWVNWCDSQFQNTKLRLVGHKKHDGYRYFFCDMGGGLGEGTGLFFRRCESPNDMDWTFTKAGRCQGTGRMTIPFRIVGYKPIGDTAAFRQMTVDDARWMARKIGQLTEGQLLEALIASGFDSAQARMYLEKLISRRDQMIADLGLTREIAPLRPAGSRRDWSYDPQKDGRLRVRIRSGEIAEAQPANWIIVHGQVVLKASAQTGSEPILPFHEPHGLSQGD